MVCLHCSSEPWVQLVSMSVFALLSGGDRQSPHLASILIVLLQVCLLSGGDRQSPHSALIMLLPTMLGGGDKQSLHPALNNVASYYAWWRR